MFEFDVEEVVDNEPLECFENVKSAEWKNIPIPLIETIELFIKQISRVSK